VVIITVAVKITVLCGVTRCSVVEHYRYFGRTLLPRRYSRNIRQKPETLVTIYQSVRRHIPEDSERQMCLLHLDLLHIFWEKSPLLYENQFHILLESTRSCSDAELKLWSRPTLITTRQFIKNSFSCVS
jgi:hypothetical protein